MTATVRKAETGFIVFCAGLDFHIADLSDQSIADVEAAARFVNESEEPITWDNLERFR